MTDKNREKNPDKQRQHYVPRVMLSRYAGDRNRLFVFDKHTGRPLPGSMTVDKICRERGFYNAEAPHGKVSLEDAFHPLEEKYDNIVGKVITNKSLTALTESEFGALVAFVCAQYLRVPRMRKAFEQMSAMIVDKARRIAPEAENIGELEQELLDDNQLRLRHLEATVSGILKGIKALWNYAWFVMEVEKGQTLWLSDCPVVLNNDEKGIYAGLGFAAPGIQIYMPMTPELILVCWHPVVAGRFITEQKTTRDLLGRLRAQFLLGTKPNKAELKSIIAKLEAAAKPIDRVVSAIKSRGLVQATADNVLHLNWQQFQWSHRFILSREDDFSLVARMLEEHPDLKTGMRMGDGFANAQ